MTADQDAGEFARLHKAFTFHFGVAVALAWMTSLYAAMFAPWVRNIRPLLNPADVGRVESTWSFLFSMPVILVVAWVMVAFGGGVLRQFRVFKNLAMEFALAGAVAFVIFYVSIDRAIAALLLAY
jgi:hypothetical protein